MLQPRFHAARHDSVQYHFFCDDKFFSVRHFKTESYQRSYVWVLDDDVIELFDSTEPMIQSDAGNLDFSVGGLSVHAEDLTGGVVLNGPDGKALLSIDFTSPEDICPKDPFERKVDNVIHQPNLRGSIVYGGRTFSGRGFCKRYWGDYPRHWGWRFLHGVTDDGQMFVWSADATFGDNKMDYLHIIDDDLNFIAAEPLSSFHTQERIRGTVNNAPWECHVAEKVRVERRLQSPGMDSFLRQTYGAMTIQGGEKKGRAFQEVCYGSLG